MKIIYGYDARLDFEPMLMAQNVVPETSKKLKELNRKRLKLLLNGLEL